MKAVLDTNVIVSAAISAKGPPAEILKAWRAQSFVWVLSEPLLDELEKTLASSRLQRYLAWSDAERGDFVSFVRATAEIVRPERELTVIEADSADNRVLEAAIEGGVDYIVSGDHHLRELKSYEEIPIVSPARFTAIIKTGLA